MDHAAYEHMMPEGYSELCSCLGRCISSIWRSNETCLDFGCFVNFTLLMRSAGGLCARS